MSLAIPRGQKTAILGSNGAGKSTLFWHFNGILKPQKGIIRYGGQPVSYDRKGLLELRKNVGIVLQDPDSQLFSASVFQEISFGPLNLGLPEQVVRERVHRAMTDTGIEGIQEKPTHMLSYGQKKRVTIADILAMEPEVLICDEPTAWLDPKHSRQMVQLFNEISGKGTTVIMSTHDVDIAYAWADYIFVMSEGRVIGEGTPEKVFRDDLLIREADLGKPWLVEVYDMLLKKGCLNENIPLPTNKDELFQLMHTHTCGGEQEAYDISTIGNSGRERDQLAVGREGV
ncbi:MAG TPA: ATP-binding cassette domain-containing protein [Bacillota bacterium]|nr:ATP-binding cassette domain-containing protein [Bacillota bacterium]